MARNGGAKIAVNGVYLISVLRLEHFDLISDVLPFGRLWYGEPNAVSNAIGYAKFYSRSHRAVIRVYDDAGNVIETHEHAGRNIPSKCSRSARDNCSACSRFRRFASSPRLACYFQRLLRLLHS